MIHARHAPGKVFLWCLMALLSDGYLLICHCYRLTLAEGYR